MSMMSLFRSEAQPLWGRALTWFAPAVSSVFENTETGRTGFGPLLRCGAAAKYRPNSDEH